MKDKIEAFTAAGPQGARLRLVEVTDFEWDTVRGYHASMGIEHYRRTLGADFKLDEEISANMTDDSAVLIFLKDGKVVHQQVLGPPVFLTGLMGEARDPVHAILTVRTRDPGPYSAIGFVE